MREAIEIKKHIFANISINTNTRILNIDPIYDILLKNEPIVDRGIKILHTHQGTRLPTRPKRVASMLLNVVPLTVFVDFRKAFDTVDFNTLLSRLSGLGLDSTCVKWFSPYLHGRTIKVALSDILSREFGVKCGVPQGSVLGPLLYLIYVISLASYVGVEALTSFADDTAITVIGSCLVQVAHKANLALECLRSFTVGTSLIVNASKTNYIIFSRTGRLLNDNNKKIFDIYPLNKFLKLGIWGFV